MEQYKTEIQIMLEQLLADIEIGYLEDTTGDSVESQKSNYITNGAIRYCANLVQSQIDNQRDIVKQIYKNE